MFVQKTDFDDIATCCKLQLNNELCTLKEEEEETKENCVPVQQLTNFTPYFKSPSIPADETNNKNHTKDVLITEDMMSPMSKWNLKWKRKSLTDSVSSIPNISINHNLTVSPKRKLVRSTSTPMNGLLFYGHRNNQFDSISHVSSINNSSDSDNNMSPPPPPPPKTNTRPDSPRKHPKTRNKMPIAATPLRQVMSKSIQRAIAVHGIPGSEKGGIQPKKMFDSMNDSSISSALDLRTSPVIRRNSSSQSSSSIETIRTGRITKNLRKQSLTYSSSSDISSPELINERSGRSIYKTCSSIELSSTNLNITPKIVGTALKKAISFQTPDLIEFSPVRKTPIEMKNDVWYTPSEFPLQQKSYSISTTTTTTTVEVSNNIKNAETELDEVFYPNAPSKIENEPSNGGGGLWSIVSSVIRMASFGKGSASSDDKEIVGQENSLIKRCASFAGYLIRKNSSDDDCQPSKRRRTSSVSYFDKSSETDLKRRRIKGRMPIERMRFD